MTIFIDSNVFVAYYNTRDEQHEKATKLIEKIMTFEYGLPVTSDYVFDETITATFVRTKNKPIAIKLGNQIASSIKMLKINTTVFQDAWKIFKTTKNTLSFTDCTNIAFLSIINDNKIATFDKEFENIEGIKVIT